MHDKLELLLKQIKLNEEFYSFFDGGSLDKILGNKNKDSYKFNITISKTLPIDVYTTFVTKLNDHFKEYKVGINFEVIEADYTLIKDYYLYLIKENVKEFPLLETFTECKLSIENNTLCVEIANKAEQMKFNTIADKLLKLFNKVGYENIDIKVIIDESKNEDIRKEIELSKTADLEIKVKKEPVEVMGSFIKDKPLSISLLNMEEDNVTVEGFVFAIDFFESSRSSFKIITLKITDFEDSVYCKVFVKDDNDYAYYKKNLKSNNWYKFRGYTKYDKYANEIVLNVRDINRLEKETTTIVDTNPLKRVELHAHTFMSQMDGVVEPGRLINQAYKWGHKAIAITDHHGCQAFPEIVKTLGKINKGNDNPFKVIYGAEFVLIDDSIDIVMRPNETNLLDNTYVVFDFETTGFNAGGGDSIIEIGAVKILNGEIIDRFNQLVNPGRKLPKTIIEITKITDDMLKDQPNEEEAITKFIEWYDDLPMVAHNAKFDVAFLEMCHTKYNLGEFKNTVIDTLELSRILDSGYSRHGLSALVKRYDVPWDETAHHRADYDAEGTAFVFHKMMLKLIGQNIETVSGLNNMVAKDEIHKYGRTYHINVLVKNREGLKNLFRLISYANTKYLYKTPRILRSEIDKYREGILVGSGCYESEVFVEARNKSDEELSNIINFYDYVEVQPLDVYNQLLQTGDFASVPELMEHIRKIIRVTKESGKLIVATGDVHHLYKDEKIYREIIVNQKVPGGGRHPLAKNNITNIPSQHLRTTDEMLENFDFLDKELVHEIVIENTNKIADMIEMVEVIIDTGGVPFSPKIENSEQIVRDMVDKRAKEIYGDDIHPLIKDRIDQELSGIIKGGYDVIYLISQKLVKKSNDDGYLVGSRGSVGSSFIAFLMGITEVNALPAHYVCPKCKHTEFNDDKDEPYGLKYSSGYDLPNKNCSECGESMNKEGQDMPFATFLGFNADKVPDIDLNFSGDYQAKAHDYTKVLFGVDNVYRAGTVSTVADKTAYGVVKGYCEEKGISKRSAEIERLAMGCTGVKRSTGQHPGGIVVIPDYMEIFDFTPYQFPADDPNSPWRTTHFDYHPMEEEILKLDILGHDDPTMLRMLQDLSGVDILEIRPFDDPKVLSLLSGTDALGIKPEDIMCNTGTLGVPELGTKFVIGMLEDTKPKTFGGLVKISGLSHGTDVWLGNAQELIKTGTVPFDEVIGCRDDIMVTLMNLGIEPLKAFKIMEFVRKGKPSKEPDTWEEHSKTLRDGNIPEWYIDSCRKIKYMFPKAHAVAYVMSALRIAWFKVYYPLYYYAAYFSIRCTDFDIETMIKGYDAIKAKIIELESKGFEASNKEAAILDVLKVALEATARGITIADISVLDSDSMKFIVKDDNVLIPPFRTIDGLGDVVAKTIVEERERGVFLSIDDLQKRGKISSTLIDKMRMMRMLDNMDESSQLSLF